MRDSHIVGFLNVFHPVGRQANQADSGPERPRLAITSQAQCGASDGRWRLTSWVECPVGFRATSRLD